jgi:RNA polymerase sigma factor (sigma-70 family)
MRTEEEMRKAIDQYADMIQKICFIHMKQQCDVDDVFQTVFLKYAKAPLFESEEHEKAWLIRVTMNACKDIFKSWFYKYTDSIINMEELSQDNSYLTYHQTSDLMQAVLSLPEHYRNVIYLFYYEGYKVSDIAAILHKKENTIHTWLKRAKVQLKDILGGDYLE